MCPAECGLGRPELTDHSIPEGEGRDRPRSAKRQLWLGIRAIEGALPRPRSPEAAKAVHRALFKASVEPDKPRGERARSRPRDEVSRARISPSADGVALRQEVLLATALLVGRPTAARQGRRRCGLGHSSTEMARLRTATLSRHRHGRSVLELPRPEGRAKADASAKTDRTKMSAPLAAAVSSSRAGTTAGYAARPARQGRSGEERRGARLSTTS